jgi:hypothetical protein
MSTKGWLSYSIGRDYRSLNILCHIVYATKGLIWRRRRHKHGKKGKENRTIADSNTHKWQAGWMSLHDQPQAVHFLND